MKIKKTPMRSCVISREKLPKNELIRIVRTPEGNVVIDETSSAALALLLSRVMNIMNDKDEPFIIDSAHILPRDIIKYIDRDKWDIYFIGYPNISKFTKFSTIRKYDDKTDWTSRRNDEELLSIIEKLISISKKIQEECEELDIPFIDTSSDMIEVIDEFFETDLI